MSFRVRFRRHTGLLLALVGGVVYALAEPPFDLYPCVLVGLGLLALTLDSAPTWRVVFVRAFAWAFAMEAFTLRPVAAVVQNFTPLGPVLAWACLPLLAGLQSIAWGASFALAHIAVRRFRAPRLLAFAAGTYLALLSPAVFAWTPAALMSPWPVLLQLADTVGEHGVSVLLAIAAALVAEAYLSKSIRPALAGIATLLLMTLHGTWRMHVVSTREQERPRMRIALLQPSIAARARWQQEQWPRILLTLRELTRRAEAEGAELTVWPEAVYPYLLPHGPGPTPRGERGIVGGQVRGPVLAGLVTLASSGNRYNSATIVEPSGKMQRPQDKLDLLWFGETVPFGDVFPWLRQTFQPRGAILPGEGARLLHAKGARIAVLNCYEDSLTARGRAMARLEPNLLVNVTNDAWFVPSAEPELHLRLSAMRSIELRRDLVRSVNMGPASWIDAAGRVRGRYDGDEPGFLMAEAAMYESPPTLYARYGHWPTASLLAGLLLVGGLVRAPSRRNAKAKKPERTPPPISPP